MNNKINEIKHCNNCNIILTDENQIKNRNQCKSCRSIKYKEYVQTKLSKQYESFDGNRTCSNCPIILTLENCIKNRPICKECYKIKCKNYKINNKSKISQNNKEYYDANKDKIAEYYKEHYKNNKDTYMENNRNWRDTNRESLNQKEKERFRNDPIARLIKNTRTRICLALKTNGKQTIKLIDCDIDFFKKWLEYNFTDEMTFDNYGKVWHIDHVIPCYHFDLTNDEEISNCFRWTNLQPLKAIENISKQHKINIDEVKSHYKKVKKYATLHNIKLPNFKYKKYIQTE